MRKNSGLLKIVLLFLIFPLVIWQLSLKKTYQLYKENMEFAQRIVAINKNRIEENRPVVLFTSPLLSNGRFLKEVDTLLKEFRVEMIRYQPILINEESSSKLYAGSLVLRGSYINLIKMIDAIERKKLPIKLSSAMFSCKPSTGKEVREIELVLLFQQIES